MCAPLSFLFYFLEFIFEMMGGRNVSDPLWVVNFSTAHFFLLEKVLIKDLIRTAIWCDVVSHSFNSRRAASATAWPCSSSWEALRARLRVVFSRAPCAVRAVEGTLS